MESPPQHHEDIGVPPHQEDIGAPTTPRGYWGPPPHHEEKGVTPPRRDWSALHTTRILEFPHTRGILESPTPHHGYIGVSPPHHGYTGVPHTTEILESPHTTGILTTPMGLSLLQPKQTAEHHAVLALWLKQLWYTRQSTLAERVVACRLWWRSRVILQSAHSIGLNIILTAYYTRRPRANTQRANQRAANQEAKQWLTADSPMSFRQSLTLV